MKNLYLFPALILMALVSCNKGKTTTNNYITPVNNPQPSFAINGITDITFTNNFTVTATLDLTIQHLDSAQENVSLALTGMPIGIIMDNNWVHSGIPTYYTSLSLFDTSVAGGVTPGTYPLTLTATSASGGNKTYTFNLKIQAMPTGFFGKYNTCYAYCGSTTTYTDSVYADAIVVNKIWFANYAGSGHSVYGMLTGQGGGVTIPSQTISGTTYTGSGTVNPAHQINISISPSCALNMF
jgi:hypothetical protein